MMSDQRYAAVPWLLRMVLAAAFVSVCLPAQNAPDPLDRPAKSVPDLGAVTTGQTISPAGVPAIVRGPWRTEQSPFYWTA
jgi:hypothetical protein